MHSVRPCVEDFATEPGRKTVVQAVSYEDFDRLPVYFFGSWPETKVRWQNEGLETCSNLNDFAGLLSPLLSQTVHQDD